MSDIELSDSDNSASEATIDERFHTLTENISNLTGQMPFGLHKLDQNSVFLSVNQQELLWLGYSQQDLIGETKFTDLLTTESRYRYEQALKSMSSTADSAVLEITLISKNTLASPFTLHIKVKRAADETVLGYQCALFVSTDRSLIEKELSIAATVFESIEGMVITNDKGIILNVNKAFSRITGYSAEEVIGQSTHILSSDDQDLGVYNKMWACLNEKGSWQGELMNRHKHGSLYPERLSISVVKDRDGIVTHYVGIFDDITESKNIADKLEQLAFYDPLTNLPNRRLLIDRLQHVIAACVRTGNKGAVLYLDLDDFKEVNNTLGHEVGDKLLIEVAERLRKCTRDSDNVARLGGDEFIVVLEGLSGDKVAAALQVEAVCTNILSMLNHAYNIGKHEMYNSSSIGAVLFDDDKQSIEQLLKEADIAMYQAKNAGRNTMMFFDQKMQDVVIARSTLNADLRSAISNKEFQLYYQVQVDDLGCAVGAEGLIRWQHPDGRLLAPNYFIPLAEESNLILPIGQWVLEEACSQIKKWQAIPAMRELVLSINISARQFKQQDFVTQVQTLIQQYEIKPHQLKLELTETMLLDDIEGVITVMQTLQHEGINFSLDDFGTGYSSLQYLQRLPIEQLKIDLSFVRDIESNISNQVIVSTIINMAQNLNLNVIAEGVETESQRNSLLEKGCKHYQGYLFSKPVPIAEFEALVSTMANKSKI